MNKNVKSNLGSSEDPVLTALRESAEPVSGEALAGRLGLSRAAGWARRHPLNTMPSTNDLAKELAAGGAPEGTLVVAEGQSRGRGRLGREWNSPPGVGLYVSVLLRPPLPPADLPQITLTAGVAVVRALRQAGGVTARPQRDDD